MKPDVKEKLRLYHFKKKYDNYPGIKSYRIFSYDELTHEERDIIDNLYRTDSTAHEKIPFTCTRRWDFEGLIKERVLPYLTYDSEIIISGVVAVFLENSDVFLQRHFEEAEGFNIWLLNRCARKIISVHETEYFLKILDRDIPPSIG